MMNIFLAMRHDVNNPEPTYVLFGRGFECASWWHHHFSEKDFRVTTTKHTSEDLTLWPELASNPRQAQAEPTTVACTASIIDSDPQMCAKSATPTPISFDALIEQSPIPPKGCVLWNRHAFMVRTMASSSMASAKDKRGGRVWSREEQHSERDSDAFGWRCLSWTLQRSPVQHTYEDYDANICRPRFQPETTFAFCMEIQRYTNPRGPRPCEAARQELGFSAHSTSTNHWVLQNPPTCERWSKLASGGEIATTHFPPKTSYGILDAS